MTYDEAFDKLYKPILRACYMMCNEDSYFADEAAAKAFSVLLEKWDEMESTDEATLKCWLANAIKFTTKEVWRKKSSAATVPLDEEWGRILVEQHQAKNERYYNPVLEDMKYENYIEEILKALRPPDQRIFRGIVLEKRTTEQMAEEFQTSENAMRVRWYRLQKKIEAIIAELL